MLSWLPPDLGRSRCIIASLVSAKDREAEARLDELTRVVAARGGEVVARVVQRRGVSRGGVEKMDAPLAAATLFGSGKVRELADLASSTSATILIVTNPLKVSQRQRLEETVGCKVVAPVG